MKSTHQKTPYHAEALQWDGTNSAAVIALINGEVRELKDYLVVRHSNDIFTMTHGWWAVRGENGVVKCYDDATFKVKYQPLKEAI